MSKLRAQRRRGRKGSPCRGALVGDKTGKYCQMLQFGEAETRIFEGLCIHTADAKMTTALLDRLTRNCQSVETEN